MPIYSFLKPNLFSRYSTTILLPIFSKYEKQDFSKKLIRMHYMEYHNTFHLSKKCIILTNIISHCNATHYNTIKWFKSHGDKKPMIRTWYNPNLLKLVDNPDIYFHLDHIFSYPKKKKNIYIYIYKTKQSISISIQHQKQ